MTNYRRVIPRDLFNEAKLLKCLGKIALDVHDKKLSLNIDHENDYMGFIINQDPNSGAIYVENLYIYDHKGTPFYFFKNLNDKDNWPLCCEYKDNGYIVFNDDGTYTDEFSNLIEECLR